MDALSLSDLLFRELMKGTLLQCFYTPGQKRHSGKLLAREHIIFSSSVQHDIANVDLSVVELRAVHYQSRVTFLSASQSNLSDKILVMYAQ